MTEQLSQKLLEGVYEITKAHLVVRISKDFKIRTSISTLCVKKIKNGPDAWCFATKHRPEDVNFVSAKDRDDKLIKSDSQVADDQLAEFYIYFNAKLSINDSYEFTATYQEPVDATLLASGGGSTPFPRTVELRAWTSHGLVDRSGL